MELISLGYGPDNICDPSLLKNFIDKYSEVILNLKVFSYDSYS